MGDIYLHHKLMDVTRGGSARSYVHLIAVLSKMSRHGTWPRLSRFDAITADPRPRAFEKDQRPREYVVDELLADGLLDEDGADVVIGEKIADLVHNTPPPGWEDGSLRAET